ncbi:MAG: SNF2-related protein [Microscillaceae bacterium]|nr:SNF2-related protein [Microscillaceae bacterium]
MYIIRAIEIFMDRFIDSPIYDRAFDIFMDESVKIVEFDTSQVQAFFQVKSQSSRELYRVSIFNLDEPNILYTECTCPYDEGTCKHALASLMALEEHLETGKPFQEISQANVNAANSIQNPVKESKPKTPQPNPTAKAPNSRTESIIDAQERVSIYHLNLWSNIGPYDQWQVQNLIWGIVEFKVEGNTLRASVPEKHKKYEVEITLSSENKLISKCSCNNNSQKICRHRYAALYKLGQNHQSIQDLVFILRDHSKTIDKALQEYGFRYQDDNWQNLFTVKIEYPTPTIKPKEKGLSKLSLYANWKNEASFFIQYKAKNNFLLKKNDKINGVLWQINPRTYATTLDMVQGKEKKNGEMGAPLKRVLPEYRQYMELSPQDDLLLDKIHSTKFYTIRKKYNLPELYDSSPLDITMDYLYYGLQEISQVYSSIQTFPNYVQNPYSEKLSISELNPVVLQDEVPQLGFELRKSDNYYVLKPYLKIANKKFYPSKAEKIAYGLILKEQNLYLLSAQDARTFFFFYDKKDFRVRQDDLTPFLRDFLIPLMEKYPIKTLGVDLNLSPQQAFLHKKLYLKEVEDYLLLTPAFVYQLDEEEFKEAELDEGKHLIIQEENTDKIRIIERNKDEENATRKFLQSLHPEFTTQQHTYFYLKIKDVLQNNWFFEMFQKLQEQAYEVLGLKNLSKIRYNPHRPQVRLKAGSGIDWFDIDMQVSFGEQIVKLADIRKALMNNQNFVKLNDGSIGILPEEWLKKYSTLLKMGKTSGDKIKISNFQYDLIDELYAEIDNNQIFEELIKKRDRLKKFKEIKNIQLPNNLQAQLRDYQKEGYNWLNFLDEFGWGGCLADDMGLGKTVQVLAFLRNISNKNKKATHLIVVPRSLVFNWVNEIQKFCPDFKVLNYTTKEREEAFDNYKKYDLIISTYGLVRSDIEKLSKIPFHYIILDESQAIKNPTAKVSRAVKLLKAKNRLVMTGTPIENNTFDLYSQLDFLNPGMLGSMEYFKNEFANLIDRDRDENAAQKLRKLVKPFILSRKKEEVAKELPEKIETIIYCDMPASQRKIYDYYRDKFRNQIMEALSQEDASQSSFEVLQGLLKLRQICNSPALLNEENAGFSHKSAKMEVLISKLEEITSNKHKVLVFSFFKTMLDLVAEELKTRNIDYSHLTGESTDRQAIVQGFKENEDKQVFLISLKAGGFGLNLTEANYVFLIDPWWNPAVEQQAIDRTHRIGQEKQVFSYKLICKDTIEEKILALQEKKQAVAKDIIQVEAGFLKKMSKKDILDLFS